MERGVRRMRDCFSVPLALFLLACPPPRGSRQKFNSPYDLLNSARFAHQVSRGSLAGTAAWRRSSSTFHQQGMSWTARTKSSVVGTA